MTRPASRKPRRPAAALPDVAPKKAPTQSRAVETYERILATAAELLGEVGIERLSTNLVCRRLGCRRRRSTSTSRTNTPSFTSSVSA